MFPTNNTHNVRAVGTPDNVTAWMRDNARHGAMKYTRNGETSFVLGAPVVYVDSDGRSVHPLFAPVAHNGRTYYKRPEMGGLD